MYWVQLMLTCILKGNSNQLGKVMFRSHKEQINAVLMSVPAIVVVGHQLSTKQWRLHREGRGPVPPPY